MKKLSRLSLVAVIALTVAASSWTFLPARADNTEPILVNVIFAQLGGAFDSVTFDNAALVGTRTDVVDIGGNLHTRNSITSVAVDPGWTYTVTKPGGIDAEIEIRFSNGTCEARFKYINRLGFSFLDGGAQRCR